jgi:hypothetical protein
MFDELDGAMMVMSCPDTGEFAIAWFGASEFRLVNNECEVVEVRNTDHKIYNYETARAEAEKWFDDLREEENENY